MGSQEDFVKGLKSALCDPKVVQALQVVISEPLQKEIQELKNIIAQKDQRINVLEKEVKDLNLKCDSNEQYSRRNNLRIHGLPESPDNDGNLHNTVVSLLNEELQLSPPLADADVDRLHRVGPRHTSTSQRPRPCIIKLTSYQARDRIYKSRSKLRHSTKEIYINEDLTQRRAALLWKIRGLKKSKRIIDGWSYDGKVSIKLLNGSIKGIIDEDQLNSLLN